MNNNNPFYIHRNPHSSRPTISKEEDLLKCLVNYHVFINGFQNKIKEDKLKRDKVYLVNKEWFEQFLGYYNIINYIFKNNQIRTINLSTQQKEEIIEQINQNSSINNFLNKVTKMKTLNKIKRNNICEVYENYVFVNDGVYQIFKKLFKDDIYSETSLDLINL